MAFGYFVMLLETIGAIMLAAGLFTRLVAPMVAVQMAMICLIHYPKWAWIDRGMEYPFGPRCPAHVVHRVVSSRHRSQI